MSYVSKITSRIYALILIMGGIMGYVKAGSLMSILFGMFSGILILLACQFGKKDPKSAYLYIAGISLCLAMFFLFRFSITGSMMPGGMMFLFSMTTFVVVGLSWLKVKNQK
ncbi:MAG: TMEM14 family protein [Candidatus Melainabacteria bacterium]|nr:TMEM14 family protein [Candidatus Melainabacteria bacterium]MBI3309546.1 TMEM14 family protein [Candidatus Melainabacteria bacterium]